MVEHDGTVLEGGFGRVSAVGVAVCEGALYLGAVAQVEGVDSFEAVAVEDAVVGDVADVVFEATVTEVMGLRRSPRLRR